MSFSDMMSSGRGPGVVGMLLAVVVMGGFGLLFLFAFDDGMQGADQSIESIITQQTKDLSSLRSSIVETQKGLANQPALESKAKQLKTVSSEIMMSSGKIEALRKNAASVQETISGIQEEFEKYKDGYRAFVRGGAKGEEIPHLTTLSGKTYDDVMIREVTPIGIQIRHKDGQMRIPFEDLSEEIRERFQFDPKQKESALAAEAKAAEAHAAAVELSDAEIQKALEAQKLKDQAAAKVAAARALAEKKGQITALKDEIRRMELAIQKESYKSLSRAPQMREELARKQSTLSTLQNQVSQLQSMANP